jgi:hypothetical protein
MDQSVSMRVRMRVYDGDITIAVIDSGKLPNDRGCAPGDNEDAHDYVA